LRLQHLAFSSNYSINSEKCTGHDDAFFKNTKSLQTLAKTRAGGRLVKYVFLTSTPKQAFFNHREHQDHKEKPTVSAPVLVLHALGCFELTDSELGEQ
jgi:hypothetical protein